MKQKSTLLTILLLLFFTPPLYSQKKTNIAVAEFDGKNVSTMDAITVSDLLRTEIVKIGKFNVVDRANMEQLLAEQAFQLTGCTTQECAVKMGKLLNVNKMIVGSVIKLGTLYLINTNMVDVETGEIIQSEKVETKALEELPKTTEYLAEILSRDTIKKKQPINHFPEPSIIDEKENNKFGIGFGYPYISLIVNSNNTFYIEPRFTSDYNEIYLAGLRICFDIYRWKSISWYSGIEYDSIWFTLDNHDMSATGIMFGLFTGGLYWINEKMNFNMDLGAYSISLREQDYKAKVSGWDMVLNAGIQIYFKK